MLQVSDFETVLIAIRRLLDGERYVSPKIRAGCARR